MDFLLVCMELMLYLLVALLLLAWIPIVILANYVIQGFVYYRIAKQTNACKPGLAWIPVVQYWVLGKCAEACDAQCGKKGWEWSKVLLILKIVHLCCGIFVLPVALLTYMLGGSLLLNIIAYLTIAVNVVTWASVYSIYRYYLSSPADILLTLVHTQFGMTGLGLFIASFIKPRGAKPIEQAAEQTACEQPSKPIKQPAVNAEPAVIEAE